MISNRLIELYRRVMCRRSLYRLNKAMYFLSQRAIGVGNWETPEASGEKWFLKRLSRYVERPVVLDVGANVGNYSSLLKSFAPQAEIYAFEPHPVTFEALKVRAEAEGFQAFKFACSDKPGNAELFDHKAADGLQGTEHASLLAEVIEDLHGDESIGFTVDLVTVDEFVRDHSITKIDLLKIDVEGAEMKVLAGARETLTKGAIDIVHFEFNETSMVSHIYLKDFVALLDGFVFYRMLSDGLAPLGTYFAPVYEIFAYQNIVAIRREIADEFFAV